MDLCPVWRPLRWRLGKLAAANGVRSSAWHRVGASQATNVGSIPITRSNFLPSWDNVSQLQPECLARVASRLHGPPKSSSCLALALVVRRRLWFHTRATIAAVRLRADHDSRCGHSRPGTIGHNQPYGVVADSSRSTPPQARFGSRNGRSTNSSEVESQQNS
jgi:hypothetical protein